jgi:ssDNA-binding replication factor A large subunit
VCPDCGRKVIDEACTTHGKVTPKRRALLNVVVDDGSENMRGTLFGEHILQLGFTEEEVFSLEQFSIKKASLLGEERVFSGVVKQNTLYNTIEFTIDTVTPVNVDTLLASFEQKAP